MEDPMKVSSVTNIKAMEGQLAAVCLKFVDGPEDELHHLLVCFSQSQAILNARNGHVDADNLAWLEGQLVNSEIPMEDVQEPAVYRDGRAAIEFEATISAS